MQEKSACERIFFPSPTVLPYYLRRRAVPPVLPSVSLSAPLPPAAPASHFCPAPPRQPTGCRFRIQHSRCLSPRLW
jgi:hypothetical protein